MIMEIELKLLIDPADVASFRRHPLLKRHVIGKPRAQQLTSIYFDTPDFQIKQHGAALRVRRVNGEWIQTLKGGGQVEAGLHQREEWESRVDGPHPDLTALRKLAGPGADWAETFTAPSLVNRLIPVFTTEFRRTAWQLRLADGCEIELALDQGDVRCDAALTPISEIELELKSGDASGLFDFALELQQKVPLRIGNVSKAERGYALHVSPPPLVVKASPLELAPTVTVEQGFQAIVGNCLAQIQGNEMGVEQGNDAESLHQMRVGLRRLRSVLGLFSEVAPCPAALLTELEWLTAELGPARDWEVFAGNTLAIVAGACPGEHELVCLQQAALAVARDKRQETAAVVASVRYARLLLALGGWTQGARWRVSLGETERSMLAAPLAKFAAQMLALYHSKLKKRGKRLRGGTDEARHRVRIAAKKVRYASEFFESLYPAKQVDSFVGALTGLQDALGWLNDAAVACSMLRDFAGSHPDAAHSAGFVQGYLAVRCERDVRKLGKLWKRFKPMKLPSQR